MVRGMKLAKKIVSTQTLQDLTRWGMKWKNPLQLSEFPRIGTTICILRHKWPGKTVSIPAFIKMHQQRVTLQNKLAETTSPNTALEGVQAVALPILSGFDTGLREFVTVMHCPQNSKSFPRKQLGTIEFAALERALCKVWSFGFQFASLDLSNISITPSFEVIMYDCSVLIGRARWLGEQYSQAIPGNTQVRFESLYAPAGDATLMLKLYGQLPPLDNPTERDKLLDTARIQLWKQQTNSRKNML